MDFRNSGPRTTGVLYGCPNVSLASHGLSISLKRIVISLGVLLVAKLLGATIKNPMLLHRWITYYWHIFSHILTYALCARTSTFQWTMSDMQFNVYLYLIGILWCRASPYTAESHIIGILWDIFWHTRTAHARHPATIYQNVVTCSRASLPRGYFMGAQMSVWPHMGSQFLWNGLSFP